MINIDVRSLLPFELHSYGVSELCTGRPKGCYCIAIIWPSYALFIRNIVYPSSTLYSLIIYQMKALFLLYQMVYKKIANDCSLLVFFRWYEYLVGILKLNCTKTTAVARRRSYGPTSILFHLKALSKLYKMVLLRGHLFVAKTLH